MDAAGNPAKARPDTARRRRKPFQLLVRAHPIVRSAEPTSDASINALLPCDSASAPATRSDGARTRVVIESERLLWTGEMLKSAAKTGISG